MNCFFSLSDALGGAEQLIYNLAKRRNDTIVCFWGGKTNDAWEKSGVRTYYCHNSIRKFYRFCSNRRFNVVFSSHLMINALLGIFRSLGILKSEKLICRESTSVFSRYKGIKLLKYKLSYFLGYRNIDLLITQSDFMRKELLKYIPYIKKRIKIVTISNPFEFPKEEVVPLNYEYPYIVSAGRLIPEKGFDILINAFVELRKINPKLKLIILGEGALREDLENQTRALGAEDYINLIGHVADVYPYFKGAKLCVVSSRIEGFPNVLLQMMSQNPRVVSTLCAGGIENIEGIFKCETKDVMSLCKAMLLALEKDTKGVLQLFHENLKSRNYDSYIEKINDYLKGNE